MNKACPNCGHVFAREEGYFTGAMFLDCIFLPVSTLPTLLIFAYNGAFAAGGVASVLQMILISPFVFRYSRLLWIHVGHQIEMSEKKGPQR